MQTNTSVNSSVLVSERLNTLFVAQAARPTTLKDIELEQLTPFQRGLMVTDGTVTRLIEAYSLSPVEVVPLEAKKQRLGIGLASWLELPIDEQVITREAVLQTPVIDGPAPKIHAYAISHIVYERLPSSVVDGLESRAGGLGALLQRTIWETRRGPPMVGC